MPLSVLLMKTTGTNSRPVRPVLIPCRPMVAADMYMYLYQSDKTTLIELDDDDGEGNNSLITCSLSVNTWYYVKVRAYYSSTTGNYSIDIKRATRKNCSPNS